MWTSNLVWSAILAAISWTMSRWHARPRGLVITLLVVTQIGLRPPFVATCLSDWLRAPGDPIPFYTVIWFSVITFVAIPFSIIVGGRAGAGGGALESLRSG